MLLTLSLAFGSPHHAPCLAGDLLACMELVRVKDDVGTQGITSLHRRECTKGSAWASDQLSIWTDDDDEQSRARQQACSGGIGMACYSSGLAAIAKGDLPAALSAFDAGCKGGSPDACDDLAHYRRIDGRVSSTLCKPKAAQICFDHGMAVLERARRIPKTPFEPAAAAFQQACGEGHQAACSQLGALKQQGRGVPKDMTAAVEHFQGACRAEVWSACTRLAELMVYGDGVEKDPVAALALHVQACGADYGPACWHLGHQLNSTDPADAAAAFARACSLGVENRDCQLSVCVQGVAAVSGP